MPRKQTATCSSLDLNTAMGLAESWAANPRVRPQPGQVRLVVATLVAEVHRLNAVASPAATPTPDVSMLEGLNYAQLDFMSRIVGPERKQVADYIRRQVAVSVVANTEVPEAPPFALDVMESPGYWLDCFDTAELATAAAEALGLPIVEKEGTLGFHRGRSY